jgi:hypothetical protein
MENRHANHRFLAMLDIILLSPEEVEFLGAKIGVSLVARKEKIQLG